MRKCLIYLVVLGMLLSGLQLAVSASEGEQIPPIRLDAASFSNGTLKDGPAEMMYSSWSGDLGIGSMVLYWGANLAKNPAACPSYDITGMDYIELVLYVSDASLIRGVPFCFELTSGGIWDVEEDSFIQTWDEITTLQDGWNTVRIPLSVYPHNNADRTRINAFRIFCQGNVRVPEGETLQLHYRKVAFGTEEKGDQITLAFDESIGVGGMTTYHNTQTRAWTMAAGADLSGGRGFVTSWSGEAMDLSAYHYVDLRFWAENPEDFRNVMLELELTSSGTCDQQESAYRGYFQNIVQGWNTVRVPLSVISRPTRGEADFSAINFVRMYTVSGVPNKNIVFELESVTFGGRGEGNWMTYQAEAGENAVLPDAVKLLATANENDAVMFADGTGEIVYSLQMPDMDPTEVLLIGGFDGTEAFIQVGTQNDPANYVDVYGAENPLQQAGLYMIDVGSLISAEDFAASGHQLYLRVADYDPSDGYGGSISKDIPLTFCVGYSATEEPDILDTITDEMLRILLADETEMKADAYTIPLFSCNMPVRGFELDYVDYKAGASSLSYTLGTVTDADGVQHTQNGQAEFFFRMEEINGKSSINASAMDTLEFWFYVSDKDALASIQFGDNAFELTSSGTCDRQEVCWRMSDILSQCEQNGWNEIRLPLHYPSTSTKDINWAGLNYMRWYFVNAANLPAQPITIKIDNIRLTNYRTQTQEIMAPIAEEMVQKIETSLSDIPSWDAEDATIIAQYEENAETWKDLCLSLRSEYDAMDYIAKELIMEQGGEVLLNRIERYLSFYEKYEADPKPPKTDEDEDDPVNVPEDENEDEDDPKGPVVVDDPKESEGDNLPEEDEEQPVARDMTMIYVIIAGAIIAMAADILIYVMLRRKDRRMANPD